VPDSAFIPNIGPGERRKRLLSGIVAFGVGVVALAVLMVLSLDRWWRLALVVPFWMAGIGFFQYREKT